jgi:hypothetical protein
MDLASSSIGRINVRRSSPLNDEPFLARTAIAASIRVLRKADMTKEIEFDGAESPMPFAADDGWLEALQLQLTDELIDRVRNFARLRALGVTNTGRKVDERACAGRDHGHVRGRATRRSGSSPR